NAGQTPEQIAVDDLEGIYSQYQELVRSLPAQVDRERRLVSVTFDDKLPPRIAAWRPGLGCTQLPIGAGAEAAAMLPQLKASRPAGVSDNRRWPDGDAGATVRTPAALAQAVAKVFDGQTYGTGTSTTAV